MSQRRAGIYVRISSDPRGQRLGVQRQLEDCRAKAEAKSWHVEGVYEDNDRSASTGAARPAYQRLLSDIRNGHINAVVVWDIDRLTRRPIEIEEFIELADGLDVALASVGGDADLATASGRLFARIKGAVARAEVEQKSARQVRANQQRAQLGRPPGGRRPFGYEDDRLSVREAEAAEVKAAAQALLDGASIRSIVADLNRREVRTTSGGPWGPTELRRMLGSPRYAGLSVYRGEVIGEGAQVAIFDRDTHLAIRAILADPGRHKAGRPQRYLLSGLARCGECGGRIYGVSQPRGVVYHCESRRHVTVKAAPVNELVLSVVAARLSQPDAVGARAEEPSKDLSSLRTEEATLQARLDELTLAYSEGAIDIRQLRTGSARLRSQLETVMAQYVLTTTPAALKSAAQAGDVRARLTDLLGEDLDGLRSIVDALLKVTLHSPGRGARTFRPETVTFDWK